MQIDQRTDRRFDLSVHVRKTWILILVPLLWTTTLILNADLALIWLALVCIYAILISLMAIMNVPNETNKKQTTVLAQKLVKIIGQLVWGGFLTALYGLVYALVFHFQDLAHLE